MMATPRPWQRLQLAEKTKSRMLRRSHVPSHSHKQKMMKRNSAASYQAHSALNPIAL